MRVIAGRFRSRVLAAPVGTDTRPTADKLRETLFNVLTQGARNWIEGGAFLDLYAGSGAVGIEAMSRGAAQVTFVERAPGALTILRKNLDGLEARSGFTVERRPVQAYLERLSAGGAGGVRARFDVLFLDPPYDDATAYASTLGFLGGVGAESLQEGAMVVAEHRKKSPLESSYGKLSRVRLMQQGDAALSFYQFPGGLTEGAAKSQNPPE